MYFFLCINCLLWGKVSVGAIVCTDREYTDIFYVELNGNDDLNDGSIDSPFATLERARDAVRARRITGEGGVFGIYIGAGEFVRTVPFELNDSDCQLCFVGIPGKTILSGASEINSWKQASIEQKKQFPNAHSEIWRAELPCINGSPIFFEQLFVNDHRAIRARFPNDGFLHPASVWEEDSMNPETRKVNVSSTRQEIRAKKGDLDFVHLPEIPFEEFRFAQFVIHHHWDTTRRIILGFDVEKNALQSVGRVMNSWNPWQDTSLYYLENLKTAFDMPGEWFYSGCEKCVYYRPFPGETISTTRFVAPYPGLNQLLILAGDSQESLANIKKVRNISFENIQFTFTDAPRRSETMQSYQLASKITGDLSKPGPSQFEPAQSASFTTATISINNAQNILFKNCEVKHVGEYALEFKNCNDCKVINSKFFDLGAGGVRIGGGRIDQRNSIENCLLSKGGRFFASATAIWIGQNTENIAVVHNDISDFFYSGISVGWVWGYTGGHAWGNLIEGNRVSNIGQGMLSDMGGIYTLGTSIGTRICNNMIFNVESYAYGGWGLYTDEGSEGILFENNLVYDTTDGAFHQHYGKDNIVRNNIFARSKPNPARASILPHQIAITRVEDHLSDTFERNIIYWKEGVALGYNADKARAFYHKNLWYSTEGEATFSFKTHKIWVKETGKDIDGLVADPLFVDPDSNDFRLKPGSPAEKIGFVPFDYSQTGIVE